MGTALEHIFNLYIKPLIVCSFFGLFSCSGEEKGFDAGSASISESEAFAQAGYLSSDLLSGRQAGSRGAQMAAGYISAYLKKLGVSPLGGNYFHFFECEPFNYAKYSAHIKDSTVCADYVCGSTLCNVLAVIEGRNSGEIVVAGAHYDHLGSYPGLLEGDCIFNGADDNVSGTVALMQVAKAFVVSGIKPERTLILAFWDGEERNCKGSSYFVENFQEASAIRHYINFDMVGRGVGDSIACICSENMKEQYLEWIDEAVDRWDLSLDVTTDSEYDVMSDSDQRPFAEGGIPCLWFFSGDNEDTHTPYDEVQHLNVRKITDVAKAAYFVLWQLSHHIQDEGNR